MNRIRNIHISEYYYILMAIAYVLTLVFSGMRPGVCGALLMAAVALQLILEKQFRITCTADVIAVSYFAYQILSVIWLLAGGYPPAVFFTEFTSSTLPMIFYFVGRSDLHSRRKWFRNYLIACMMLGGLGVLLYAFAPQFYCDWAYRWSYISKADASTLRVRMHSVVGSTCLSYLMVAGLCAGSYFLADNEEGQEERSHPDKRVKNYVFAVAMMALCLLFSIMANQRSGLAAAAIVLVYINVLLFFKLDVIPKKYFLYEIVAVAVVFFAVCAIRFDFILKYWYRIISLPSAVSQRSEQWVAAVNNMYSSWLGNGLGANGHRALAVEDAHVIADGGLVKLYCENGVLGFSLFAYLIFCALSDGVRDIRKNFAAVGIIAAGLLQSIGSNMLAFQICAPVFWLCVGLCVKKSHR